MATTDPKPPKLCDDCKFCSRLYADDYIFSDWSGRYTGDVALLPKKPDPAKFWTYMECSKNAKKLQFINLDGKCTAFQPCT